MTTDICLRGVRTHNLKNFDLSLPRDQLIVITGVSGSGKSSLAFDTLYAEGQRRYVESLSTYARQFLSMMEKPDVDQIEGLSPAIAIEQKSTLHNPRSTVGTITEIYDYLRLLFARVGQPRCPIHHHDLKAQTISQMVDYVQTLPKETALMILAPVVRGRKGVHAKMIERFKTAGFLRVRLDGTVYDIDELPKLGLRKKHTIEVVVDRIKVRPGIEQRLAESFETAARIAEGLVAIAPLETALFQEHIFSTQYACPECGYNLSELEPRLFSFNNPAGACPTCDGLGIEYYHDEWSSRREDGSRFLARICETCEGSRLRVEARHVFLQNRNLPHITELSIREASRFFESLKLEGRRATIAAKILKEINARLKFLIDVGLDYLNLARRAETLSGGEAQRIRLASQVGSGLVGVMYILDEPSIGLHQRDNQRLLQTLTRLRDLGNTVIVVEHDEEAIRAADHIIDLGPGAGTHGGKIVAEGSLEDILNNGVSLTGQYLSGKKTIPWPKKRVSNAEDRWVRLRGARCHNLKNIDVDFPIGLMTCITGVSGSGKSSLITDTLYPAISRHLAGEKEWQTSFYTSLTGLDYLDKVIDIDQSPIGRTPRSNPATYTGVFTFIRELFAGTLEARSRGYHPGRFSFNVDGGRCAACEGDGVIKVEMHFLADIYVVCDVCKGQRYNRETLEIHYKGKNIADVLQMTVEEALKFFAAIPPIARKLQTLVDVGLSYLTLGQNAVTLSGGEAQRIKLSRELSKRETGRTVYILDEPTTGLHFHDVSQLLRVLQRLREGGNTIWIIEHNLDVIKTCDWVIDLGPEGGENGGEVIATGTPETIASCERSYTGQFLKKSLTEK